jgi:hypothetical protein
MSSPPNEMLQPDDGAEKSGALRSHDPLSDVA